MNLNNRLHHDKKPDFTNKSSELKHDGKNIRQYLNTSFEQSGISVSEELIQKTLAAINENGAGTDKGLKTDKGIPLHHIIFRMAGACAAVIIAVAGIHFMGNIGGGKGSMDEAPFSVAFDTSSNSASEKQDSSAQKGTEDAGELYGRAEEPQGGNASPAESALNSGGAASPETAPASGQLENGSSDNKSDKKAADASTAAAQEPKEAALDDVKPAVAGNSKTTSQDASADETERETDTPGTAGTNQDKDVKTASSDSPEQRMTSLFKDEPDYTTFRDIFLSDPKQAEYLTIKDVADNSVIEFNRQEQILEFYSVMDQQEYTNTAEVPANQSYSYIIEVRDQQSEDTSFTMEIGDSISVSKKVGSEISETYYKADDMTLLNQAIGTFYAKNVK